MLRHTGVLGNNIFFISSAWYLLDSNKTNVKKIVFMLVEIWIISVLIMTIFSIVYKEGLDTGLIIQSFFPTTFSLNWYLTCYIIFYAIHPLINKIIYSINQRTLLRCALTMSTLYIFMNCIKGGIFQSSYLILWLAIYFCIAYMKLYLQDISQKKLFNWTLIILGIVGNCVAILLINFMGLHVSFLSDNSLYWNTNYNPMLIMAIIGLFNLVRYCTFNNNIINKISSLSLLVYILHENIFVRTYLRPYIWQSIYKVFGYDFILMWILIQVLTIFIVSLIVCTIYKYTLKKIVNKLSNKIYLLLCKIYNKIENTLLTIT